MNFRRILLSKHLLGGSGGGGGDASTLTKLIEGTVPVDLVNNQVTIVRASAFDGHPSLRSVDFPAVTSIGKQAFNGCSKLATANFPAVTSIGDNAFSLCSTLVSADFTKVQSAGVRAFQGCTSITAANFPAITKVGQFMFASCTALVTVDISAVTTIETQAFQSCTALKSLILRNTTAVSKLSLIYAINTTPIASGTGYIYVPRALVDSYKAATNWSNYAAQFRALEDYTVDGTVTGELDPNKI